MAYLSWNFIHKTRILFSHTITKFVGKFQAVCTLFVSGVIPSFTVTLSVIVNGEKFVPFVFGHSYTQVQYLIQSRLDMLNVGEVGELVFQSAIIRDVQKTPLRLKFGQRFCRTQLETIFEYICELQCNS